MLKVDMGRRGKARAGDVIITTVIRLVRGEMIIIPTGELSPDRLSLGAPSFTLIQCSITIFDPGRLVSASPHHLLSRRSR